MGKEAPDMKTEENNSDDAVSTAANTPESKNNIISAWGTKEENNEEATGPNYPSDANEEQDPDTPSSSSKGINKKITAVTDEQGLLRIEREQVLEDLVLLDVEENEIETMDKDDKEKEEK